jgi:hypothetical protein
VEDPEFIGNFKDVEISAGGRIRLPLARRVAWMGELAGQLHITSIEGDLQTAGRRGRADRVNTSVSVAGYLRWRLTSRFHADVAVRGAMALRRQRYLVADEPVFSLPLATLEAALGIVIAL